MIRKARIWIGVTLLLVLALNYAIIGFPLINKGASIKDKSKALLVKQLKSGGTEDEYVLEIFRREKSAIDRKILILNCITVSLSVIVISWTVFGLMFYGVGKYKTLS